MNRKAILIAAPLLALVAAIVIRQALRASQSAMPNSDAVPPMVEAQQAEAGEPSAEPRNAPAAPQADTASSQALEPALAPGALKTSTRSPQLGPITEAIETSYASSIAYHRSASAAARTKITRITQFNC